MTKSQSRTGRRLLTVGATAAVAASTVLTATALPAYAATATLSQTQVAAEGGTVLRINGTGLDISDAMGVRFAPATGACPASYDAATPAGTVSAGLMDAFGTSQAVIVTPAGLTAGTSYKICVYADATTGLLDTTDTIPDVTAVNMTAQNTTVVKATDKLTLTAASGIYTAASYASQVVSGTATCPTTYTAVGTNNIVAATTKVSATQLSVTIPTITAATPYLVCTYAGTTAGTSALVSRARSTVSTVTTTLPAATMSPTGGSSATATTATLTLPTTGTTAFGTPVVYISQNACAASKPATLGTDYVQGTVTKISNYKIAVTVPTSVVVSTGDVTTPWNLCTYASTTTGSALLLQPSVYNVAPVLSVSGAQFSVNGGAAGGTGSGPAQGNSVVTITGLSGIPTAEGAVLSANFGGSPLTITGKTATSITGTTSAHAPGAVKFSITTAAGTRTTSGEPYTYNNGITVVPNTAQTGTTPIVDITGAGFSNLTFGDVTTGAPLTANTAYVFLTDNAWNAQDFATAPVGAFDVEDPISYCNSVLPISDTEIICTLNLDARIDSTDGSFTPTITTANVPNGTYTVTVVNSRDGLDEDVQNYSIVSSTSTFTVAPY